MEKLYKKTFYSWIEEGSVFAKQGDKHVLVKDRVRTIALCDGTWFNAAINALRDGDMGEKDENGVYSRIWWADDMFNAEIEDLRPATIDEVNLYLKYYNPEVEAKDEGREIVSIIYGRDQTDVIFKTI